MTFFRAEMTVKFEKVGLSPEDLPSGGNFGLTRKHFKQFRSDQRLAALRGVRRNF